MSERGDGRGVEAAEAGVPRARRAQPARLKVTRLPELASLELEAEAIENGEQLEVTSRLFSPLRSRLQVAGERDAGRVKLRARSLAGGEQ